MSFQGLTQQASWNCGKVSERFWIVMALRRINFICSFICRFFNVIWTGVQGIRALVFLFHIQFVLHDWTICLLWQTVETISLFPFVAAKLEGETDLLKQKMVSYGRGKIINCFSGEWCVLTEEGIIRIEWCRLLRSLIGGCFLPSSLFSLCSMLRMEWKSKELACRFRWCRIFLYRWYDGWFFRRQPSAASSVCWSALLWKDRQVSSDRESTLLLWWILVHLSFSSWESIGSGIQSNRGRSSFAGQIYWKAGPMKRFFLFRRICSRLSFVIPAFPLLPLSG